MSAAAAAEERAQRVETVVTAFSAMRAFEQADAETLLYGVPDALKAALGADRFQLRLRQRAMRRFGAASAVMAPHPMLLKLIEGGPREIVDLVNRAGAIWCGKAVMRVTDADTLRAISGALGCDPREEALSNARLHGLRLAGSGNAEDADALVEALRREGAACWLAWLEAAPESARGAVLAMTPATLRRLGAQALRESSPDRRRALVIAALLRRSREEAERPS